MIKKDVHKPTDILNQLHRRNVLQNLIQEPKTLGLKEKMDLFMVTYVMNTG